LVFTFYNFISLCIFLPSFLRGENSVTVARTLTISVPLLPLSGSARLIEQVIGEIDDEEGLCGNPTTLADSLCPTRILLELQAGSMQGMQEAIENIVRTFWLRFSDL